MFRELRNKMMAVSIGITTIVIVTVFSFIYFFETHLAHNRPPMGEGDYTIVTEDSEDVLKIINLTIEQEKQAAAHDLLITLIVSGVVIELVVAVISYVLAEEAIKPVRETYEAQKVFIANASHEIKTPLAAISANLEAADIKGNKWIDNVARETEKLTVLNGELLTLAQTDLTKSAEAREVSLNKLVAENLESFGPRLDEVNFKKTLAASGKVKINTEDFAQILRILVDNALKYCANEVRLTVNNKSLVVVNDGAKIKADDLPHVFDRFYQTDKNSEGVGLGLAIAKAAADRNGWKLSVTSGKMTEFILSF